MLTSNDVAHLTRRKSRVIRRMEREREMPRANYRDGKWLAWDDETILPWVDRELLEQMAG